MTKRMKSEGYVGIFLVSYSSAVDEFDLIDLDFLTECGINKCLHAKPRYFSKKIEDLLYQENPFGTGE